MAQLGFRFLFFTTTTLVPQTTTLTIPPIEETVGIDWNPLENTDLEHAPIFVGMDTVEIEPNFDSVEISPNFSVERVETSESKRSQSLNRAFQPTVGQSKPKPFKPSQPEASNQVVKSSSKSLKASQVEAQPPKLSRVFKPSRRKHGRKVPNARKRFGQKVASSRY